MKKKVLVWLSIISLGIVSGCSSQSEKLNISGSTSIAPLMEKLVEDYTKENDVTINVNADGSSAGIKAASEGVSAIGMSSRMLKDDEKKLDLKEEIIAKDAIAVVTNKSNKVSNLSKKEVQDIFIGKIKNWKEIGGDDMPITVLSREDGSGTRSAFEEILKLQNDDESSKVNDAKPVIVNSTGAVLENVKSKAGAIGYISLGSTSSDIKVLSIDKVIPSENSVKDSSYIISRPFLLVSKAQDDATKKFIDFILSSKGQEIISAEGYVKLN